MAKYEIITCEECTAEFDIKVINEDELNNSEIRFCPCCGKKMSSSIAEDDSDEFDAQYGEWDDQGHDNF